VYPDTRQIHAWIGLPSSKRVSSQVMTSPLARSVATRSRTVAREIPVSFAISVSSR